LKSSAVVVRAYGLLLSSFNVVSLSVEESAGVIPVVKKTWAS